MLQWDDSPRQAVSIAPGDTILGDTLRSTVAGVVVSSLMDVSTNADVAVVNEEGAAPSDGELLEKLLEASA